MSQNIFNPDFQEFILALNESDVDYVLVGGYAVILHGYSRTTGDMDIWVHPTEDNYKRLSLAYDKFGLSVFDMSVDKFLDIDNFDVFSFGRPPFAIDIMTKVKGLTFEDIIDDAEWFYLEEHFKIRVLKLADLIKAKRASSRYKDLDDIENLS